jgi:site-specific recombinase XerC
MSSPYPINVLLATFTYFIKLQRQNHQRRTMALDITALAKYLTYLPWQKSMTLQPIEQVLSAPLQVQKDLCRAWQKAKLEELSFVGLAVSTT